MIIRERDKKKLKKSIEENKERILDIKNEIDVLKSELVWRVDKLDTDTRRLAMMEVDDDEHHTLARCKPRHRNETKLTAFVKIG